MLVDPVAELHQGSGIEPLPRDVAGDGLVQDGLGGRAEGDPLTGPEEFVVLGREIELVAGEVVARHQVIDQPHRQPAGQRADGLVEVAEDDVVDAVLAGGSGLAAGDLVAGGAFQLQRDVLDDVPGPGALDQPLDEATVPAAGALVVVQAGQQGDQGLGEAGQRVGRELLQPADVDDHVDGHLVGVVVRAPVHPKLPDGDVGLAVSGLGLGLCRLCHVRAFPHADRC